MYEMYEILVAQKHFRSPPTVSTYDRVNSSDCTRWLNLSKLCHVSTTSSALQDTTARGVYKRMVASYRRYEYYDDLSDGLSVINNTTDLSEGLPVINNTSTITT